MEHNVTPETISESSLEDCTVLVVDDNPNNLSVVVDLLETVNVQVIVAKNGKIAIERAAKITPELILMDVMMPVMGGVEATRQLKAQESTKHIPIIFMTALNSIEDKLSAFQAGAVDFVTKPIEEHEFLARVTTQLKVAQLTLEQKRQNEILEERVAERTKELEAEKLKAQASSNAKSRFIDVVSHELRTPLNAIIGFTDFLLSSTEDAETKRILGEIEKGGDRLTLVVSQILDYARALPPSPTPIAPSEFLKGMVAKHKAKAEEKGLIIGFEYIHEDELESPLFLDETLLAKVFTNLVDNAIRFTESGKILLRGTYRKHESTESGVLTFEIQDNGCGMSEDEFNKVLEPFTQLDDSWTRKHGGIGMGLSLSSKFLQDADSALQFRPNEPNGSIFSFDLEAPIAELHHEV